MTLIIWDRNQLRNTAQKARDGGYGVSQGIERLEGVTIRDLTIVHKYDLIT